MRHDVPGTAVTGPDQVFGAGDEVGEGVLLGHSPGVQEPAPALVRAATDVGDGIDPAAIDKAQPVCRERGGHGDAVGAVTVEKQRGRTIHGRVAAAQDGDRHHLPIQGRRVQSLDDIVGRIVARGNFLDLSQRPLARSEIVVIGRGRRGRRVIAVAHDSGVELRRSAQIERVGRFVHRDLMLCPCPVADDDAGVGVGALLTGDIVPYEGHALDEAARRMRDQVTPVGLARRRRRGLDDLEVDRVVRIGPDDPAVPPVVGAIEPCDQARLEHARRGGGRVARHIARLRRFLVLDADHEEAVV